MNNEKATMIGFIITGVIIGAFNAARAREERQRKEELARSMTEMRNKIFKEDLDNISNEMNALLENVLKKEQEHKDALEKTRKEWNETYRVGVGKKGQ